MNLIGKAYNWALLLIESFARLFKDPLRPLLMVTKYAFYLKEPLVGKHKVYGSFAHGEHKIPFLNQQKNISTDMIL